MKIEIKSWWTGSILFEGDFSSLAAAVAAALKSRADLTGANLTGADLTRANLTGANLTGADLTRADLTGANLTGADLTRANLTGANLTGADLTRANLTGADLTRANLTRANLTGANLTGADLTRANLTGADLTRANLTDANLTDANLTRANLTDANLTDANLTGADLTKVRDDFWAVLSSAPKEVAGLRAALIAGKVNGSTYTGECACLVGTIANTRGTNIDNLGSLKPNSDRPAERFFFAIRQGDTPEKNAASKIVVEWLDEWVGNMQAAFGPATTITTS